ncbi:membrane protein [Sphingomonas astaxanthinifaciens DSM 22298]|uniref:Membrane protein n=2 Tax=Sphingomonas TaxID=13687 RepID=A0ABQ5Z6E7_9SPHN|nr:membrane protein [Sphingomonas astaxanthinifaciens DSM 22298]
MNGDYPRATAHIGGHPLHPLVAPFPIVSFIGAFVTDTMWLASHEAGWATASNWLIGVGLVTALLAAATGMADYLGDDRVRRIGQATRHMIANVVVVTLEAVSLFVRLGGGSEMIGSLGIWLGGASVAILVYSGWLGGELVYRHRVGVRDPQEDEPAASSPKFSRDRR